MKNLYSIDLPIKVILEVYEEAIWIGREIGRKAGDDIGDIFFTILREKGLIERTKKIGEVEDLNEYEIEQIANGKKVLNLNELMDRYTKEKKEEKDI